MQDGNSFYLSYTRIAGDTLQAHSLSPAHTDEPLIEEEFPLRESLGIMGGDSWRGGFELGTAGVTGIFGYRPDFWGALGWVNLNSYAPNGGAALGQIYHANEYVQFGASQYYSANALLHWENDYSMFKNYVGGRNYHELGLGTFVVARGPGFGISGEYKFGKEIGHRHFRHYWTVNMFWI